MLIKQKDIFPVLQSILKLLVPGVLSGKPTMSTAVSGSGSWMSRPDQDRLSPQPPAKKRKLTRVPAGAADWDVPYPFQEGEGPTAYKQTWVKERGRQLISQLIGLVKIAARKAAAKKHLVELQQKRQGSSEAQEKEKQGQSSPWHEGGRGANHYRNESGKPNLVTTTPHQRCQQPSQKTEPQVPVTPNFGNLNTDPSGLAAEGSISTSAASFSDFFSALLAASDASDATSSYSPPPIHPSCDHPTPPPTASNPLPLFDLSSTPGGDTSQSVVDSWMDFFQFQVDSHSSESVSLESLLGLDSSLIGNLSSFASPSSGDLSSFSTTPNPDAQQGQNFPPFDFAQLGDLAPVTTSCGSSSSGLGSFPPSTIDMPVPMDFTFDLPTTVSDCQAHTSTSEENLMDVDQPLLPFTSYIPPTPVPTPAANVDFNSLIDPQLLALSLPDHNTPTAMSPQPSSSSISQLQGGQKTAPNDAGTCSPSAFLPSPISSLDPATPSSAGWDMSMPDVIATESDRDQGMWWTQFLALDVKSDAGRLGGVELSRMSHGSLGHKSVGDVGGAHMSASATSIAEVAISPAPTRENLRSNTQSLAVAQATPGPSQPSGVFQVLRVTDLQPTTSAPKLKKSEVLKRAEEKRKELKAQLDQAKTKLWEATIEHGALLHLMRMAGEAENVSGPSSSQGS